MQYSWVTGYENLWAVREGNGSYISRHHPPLLPQSAEAILLAEDQHCTSASCTQVHIASYLPVKLEAFCTLKDDLLQQNVK